MSLTDAYVVSLHAWANTVLGISRDDRLRWRGERRCLGKLQAAGDIR